MILVRHILLHVRQQEVNNMLVVEPLGLYQRGKAPPETIKKMISKITRPGLDLSVRRGETEQVCTRKVTQSMWPSAADRWRAVRPS